MKRVAGCELSVRELVNCPVDELELADQTWSRSKRGSWSLSIASAMRWSKTWRRTSVSQGKLAGYRDRANLRSITRFGSEAYGETARSLSAALGLRVSATAVQYSPEMNGVQQGYTTIF